MIELCDVEKKLKGNTVLCNINIRFRDNCVYLLQGPNGAGKTMLLKVLAGLIQPDVGTITMDKKYCVGVSFDTTAFRKNETVLENLKYLARINNLITEADIQSALDDVLLREQEKTLVRKLSLGMLQKLSICQAVMEKPELILLDEPFNALDTNAVDAVWNVITQLQSTGHIIVIAAHGIDYTWASKFDGIITMHDGRAELNTHIQHLEGII